MSDLAARVAALEEQMAVLVAGRPRRVYMSDVIRFQLPKVLPDLMRKHPAGVTTQHVADHFGFPVCTTVIAIAGLVKAGKVVRHRLRGSHFTAITLPGQEAPTPPLTVSKRRVLEGMAGLSQGGRLEMSLNMIGRNLGISPHTLHYTITALILEKRVTVLRRGKSSRPSAYFIPSAIQ